MRLTQAFASATAPPPVADGLLKGLTPEASAVAHCAGSTAAARWPGRRRDQDAHPPRRLSDHHRRGTPSEILAVTFSVQAAGELRLRLAELLGREQTAE
jgi:DNA helicase-2/ATP-dependent DNA helicase PcrA